MAGALGVASLIGLAAPEDGGHNTWEIPTGVSEPVHWSGLYDIDTAGGSAGWNSNHRGNVPEVRAVDESDNAFGKTSATDEQRTHIVDNYGLAKKFFDEETGIATEAGQANFKSMQDAVDQKAKELKEQHGDSMTEKRAREVAEKWVKAQLASLAAHQAEADATK